MYFMNDTFTKARVGVHKVPSDSSKTMTSSAINNCKGGVMEEDRDGVPSFC